MTDALFQEILSLKWVIVSYVALTSALYILFVIMTKRFLWSRGKINAYGVLYNLSTGAQMAFAVIICRFAFVIITALRIKDTGIQTFIAFILMTAVIVIPGFEIKKAVRQIITYIAVSGILLLESLLWHYYMEVERFWVAMAVCVFLGLFACLYAAYDALISYKELYGKASKSEIDIKLDFKKKKKNKNTMDALKGSVPEEIKEEDIEENFDALW